MYTASVLFFVVKITVFWLIGIWTAFFHSSWLVSLLWLCSDKYFCSVYLLLYAAAVQEQTTVSATIIGSIVGDSSPPDTTLPKEKSEEKSEPLGFQIQHMPIEVEPSSAKDRPLLETEFHLEPGMNMAPSVEHQFIPSFFSCSPSHQNSTLDRAVSQNLSSLRSDCEDPCVSLQLGDHEAKRQRSDASVSMEELK